MAKATLCVELKSATTIEVTVSGKRVGTRTQRFEFASEQDAQAAMVRGIECALNLAKNGVPA